MMPTLPHSLHDNGGPIDQLSVLDFFAALIRLGYVIAGGPTSYAAADAYKAAAEMVEERKRRKQQAVDDPTAKNPSE